MAFIKRALPPYSGIAFRCQTFHINAGLLVELFVELGVDVGVFGFEAVEAGDDDSVGAVGAAGVFGVSTLDGVLPYIGAVRALPPDGNVVVAS